MYIGNVFVSGFFPTLITGIYLFYRNGTVTIFTSASLILPWMKY